jgi:oxygen-independent coproporphyrinogen-3 oxidase
LKEAISKKPDHVSVYDLQIEEGTPFGRWYVAGEGPMPVEELSASMFRDASARLAKAGFEHYEVSSYALPGKRCSHNQVYWNSGKQGWYGFGMAATSHVDSRSERVARPRKMRDWEVWVDSMMDPSASTTAAKDGGAPSKPSDELFAEALLERLMLGLRTRDGIHLDAIALEFGERVVHEILEVFAEQPRGLATVVSAEGNGGDRDATDPEVKAAFSKKTRGARVRLTDPEGLMVSTEIISTLVARMKSLESL